MHDPDLLEYVLKKMGPSGADRIVLGSDYPFPLGEVPVAGKMLLEDERVRRFLSWEQRARVLGMNAIRFLNLGQEFRDRFEERLREFDSSYGYTERSCREGLSGRKDSVFSSGTLWGGEIEDENEKMEKNGSHDHDGEGGDGGLSKGLGEMKLHNSLGWESLSTRTMGAV